MVVDASKPSVEEEIAAMVEEGDRTPITEGEPEVRVEGERREGAPQPSPEGAAPPGTPSVEERLASTLETIKRLEGEIEGLRRPTPKTERVEPQVEYEEVLGVRLPKNREQRPVRLTEQDLHAMNWNENPTGALETLGNVLFFSILEAAVDASQRRIDAAGAQRAARAGLKARFYDKDHFSDLADQDDLVDLTEQRLRREGLHQRVHTEDEYLREVGKQTRMRVATLRGQTLEEYEAGLSKGASASGGYGRAGGSRASLPAGGGRGGGKIQRTDQQKEMDDLDA